MSKARVKKPETLAREIEKANSDWIKGKTIHKGHKPSKYHRWYSPKKSEEIP